MFYLSFTDFRFMSVCFILAWCFIALPVSPSPHITLHFPQCFTLPVLSSQTEKDNPQSRLSVVGRKTRRPIRVFLCCSCFYQYCRLVHQKFWRIGSRFNEVTRVLFPCSLCLLLLFEKRRTLVLWTLWDERRRPSRVMNMDTNKMSVQKKKPQKDVKRWKKKD